MPISPTAQESDTKIFWKLKNYNLTAKTFHGLEGVLAGELKQIGAQNIRTGNRAVFFEGDKATLYKANYFLRTAIRVLKEVTTFSFKNVDQFYLRCKQIDWSNYFDARQSFRVNSLVINSPGFNNSMYASLRVKDAIADYFRETTGNRPSVDIENPDIIVDVFINQDRCTLSLDSSGESLHKRGYRIKQGEAPLSEVLAAGMILLTGWEGNSDFLDPMCGSGTLPIEAAMIACNIPAGKFRKEYAFQKWSDYDESLFENIKIQYTKKEFKHTIYAADISATTLLNAQTNARRAQVFNKIRFITSDFGALRIPLENAVIVMNPPYGERIKPTSLNNLYSMIGERLKHHYTGNEVFILSSSTDSLKHIGLRPANKQELFNGPLRCRFNQYQLFSGKLRHQ